MTPPATPAGWPEHDPPSRRRIHVRRNAPDSYRTRLGRTARLETMDHAMRDLICNWVHEKRGAGATILVATHDLEPFAADVDRIIVARNGAVRLVDADALGPDSGRLAQLERLASGAELL